VSDDGGTLWVAAFGSGVVARVDAAALAAGTFVPDAADHVALTGGGPTGVVLDATRGRLYVLTRFDNAVSVVDVATRRETAHVPLHNPEPASVVAGRPLLYDARTTSSNGEAACASCHVFGDLDGLAWDLGNPDGRVVTNPNPIHSGDPQPFHPMKGPMATQSLRGMASHGPMHWRGDRTGGSQPDGDPLAEDQAFAEFIVAFESLLGRGAPIAGDDMRRFADFALQITYPPNPIRALDGTLAPEQQAGRQAFFDRITDGGATCASCHTLSPRNGFFGTDGQTALQGGPQLFKIPHLRNLYQKVGMFGGDATPLGPQVRGFGFAHDGSVDTIFRFLSMPPFTIADTEKRQLEQFLLVSDTNLAPVVGQQATLTAGNAAAVGPRVDLLCARSAAGDCDLVVKGVVAGEARGWLQVKGDLFVADRVAEDPLSDLTLRAVAETPGQELTWTCVPPGTGPRVAIDRDEDGFLDRDELDAGTDPADAASRPPGSPLPLNRVRVRTSALQLAGRGAVRTRFGFTSRTHKDALDHRIVPPPGLSVFDPTRYGAELYVYNAAFTTDAVVEDLPASGWRRVGSARRPKGFRFRGRRGAPIRSVLLGSNVLRVNGRIRYSLDEPAQGRVAMRLAPGLFPGGGWCAAAPAHARGKEHSTARSDRPGRFRGAPGSAPPEACPRLP
jgi:YVTN family beta-propeller protein